MKKGHETKHNGFGYDKYHLESALIEWVLLIEGIDKYMVIHFNVEAVSSWKGIPFLSNTLDWCFCSCETRLSTIALQEWILRSWILPIFCIQCFSFNFHPRSGTVDHPASYILISDIWAFVDFYLSCMEIYSISAAEIWATRSFCWNIPKR